MPSPAREPSWTDEHTVVLLRAIVHQALAARPDYYTLPELRHVSQSNYRDKINKKTQQLLRSFCAAHPGAEAIVEEEAKKLAGGKGRKARIEQQDDGTPSPSPAKKRKAQPEPEMKNEADF